MHGYCPHRERNIERCSADGKGDTKHRQRNRKQTAREHDCKLGLLALSWGKHSLRHICFVYQTVNSLNYALVKRTLSLWDGLFNGTWWNLWLLKFWPDIRKIQMRSKERQTGKEWEQATHIAPISTKHKIARTRETEKVLISTFDKLNKHRLSFYFFVMKLCVVVSLTHK